MRDQDEPVSDADPAPNHPDTQDTTAPDASAPEPRQSWTSDDFLVPGPSPESNAGLARWGCTWLAFSLLLILLMLAISFICWMLATWTGFA